MKTILLHEVPLRRISFGLCLAASLPLACLAQGSSNPPGGSVVPVVTIRATDPIVAPGHPGIFTVFRAGDTNQTLHVYYQPLGSASNGVDYVLTPPAPWVDIPAGMISNNITVTAAGGTASNLTKTVVAQLTSSPLGMPVNYSIGWPSNATVYLSPVQRTNQPPTVSIVTPTNGAVFVAPVNIPIVADGRDVDGYVATVEFFDGPFSLGLRTNNPVSGSPVNPFILIWSNAPPGYHTLTAVATDNQGVSAVSLPVNITVQPVIPPQPVAAIAATVPRAAEPCQTNPAVPGKFTVYRDTGTNLALQVWLAIGGTASNGQDYVAISNMVLIPQGAVSVDIPIVPLADPAFSAAAETVVITILPPVCPAIWPPWPGCYRVGQSAQAQVAIAQCPGTPTNLPPVVRITSPPNCAVFRAPVNIPIYSYAFDPDGFVSTVECLAGTNSLGFAQRVAMQSPGNPVPPISIASSNTFLLVWSNAPVGDFVLTAKATDNGGSSTVSAPVTIKILSPVPPPTNPVPVVSITASDPIAIEGTNCWPWVVASATGATRTPVTVCGPKNASFTVWRLGRTNEALLVSYSIGGTATNGVDYGFLNGTVTIPAGYRSAPIPLIPIDDGPPDISSTVVLRLNTNAVAPANSYLVGYPSAAAALILDGRGPLPIAANLLPDSSFHLRLPAPCGDWFRIECSRDLVTWQPLAVIQAMNGSIDLVDSDAHLDQARFYRAVPDVGPPQ